MDRLHLVKLRAYPRETYDYLKRNSGRIPPAGWTAATEKLSAADKEDLKQLRVAARASFK